LKFVLARNEKWRERESERERETLNGERRDGMRDGGWLRKRETEREMVVI
jgi:hypothetical protein